MKHSVQCSLLALGCALGMAAQAATITIVNVDGPGEGFNDPTPVAAVAGNPRTTRGGQRLYLFQRAAEIWGSKLISSVEIRVRSAFDPMPCAPGRATLGGAYPVTGYADFPSAPWPDTLYPAALAHALEGMDMNDAQPEIDARFNSSIDNGCFGPSGSSFWYGTSGPGPAGRTNLMPTVLHELAHGLGFTPMIDRTSAGTIVGHTMGIPSEFSWNTHHLPSGRSLGSMTAAEIRSVSTSDPNLVWTGRNVYGFQHEYLSPMPSGPFYGTNGTFLRIHAPSTFTPGSSLGHFTTAASPNLLMEPSITATIFDRLDLTPMLLSDIGWALEGW